MKLYWAKVKENAILPKKRDEDAGYDLYACFEEDYLQINPLETKMIPLGIASAFEPGYVMFLKERGSTGTKGMAQRSGVIDSGYRGEYICPVTNAGNKPVLIIKKEAVNRIENPESFVLYPYEKAICQGVLLACPNFENEVVSYEDLMKMESERMEGKLGSSGN